MADSILPDGARSNGLPARQWVIATATTPLITDHLLIALREAGIAAYSLPFLDDSVYRGLSLNSPLYHQIFVDRNQRELAGEIIAREQAELAQLTGSPDTEFNRIVSQFDSFPTTSYLDELDESDHYEPPLPEPIPKVSRTTRLALFGVLGGPFLVAVIALTGIDPIGIGVWPGLIAFVAGFVTLLTRAKEHNEDEDPGGGAVV